MYLNEKLVALLIQFKKDTRGIGGQFVDAGAKSGQHGGDRAFLLKQIFRLRAGDI
jgi:hypothetical protein